MTHDLLTNALKEWQVAVHALERGETIVLLRKGGIREEGGRFRVQHDRVLLYPTVEHQKPELVKPAYADQVQTVASGWHPEQVRIGSWAEITDIVQIDRAEGVAALFPFHIWNEQFVRDRLRWKPSQPLYVLLLRVYQFTSARLIPHSEAYGSCKSWIDLHQSFDPSDSLPVLDDRTYAQTVEQIIHHTRCSKFPDGLSYLGRMKW
jgi:hypothetical protein